MFRLHVIVPSFAFRTILAAPELSVVPGRKHRGRLVRRHVPSKRDAARKSTTLHTDAVSSRRRSAHGESCFWLGCDEFLCARIRGGGGKPSRAIEYLESGVTLEGATGTCSFSSDNHNGRAGFGPTTLTRWHKNQLEEVNETR
jgi:hypothetical protein